MFKIRENWDITPIHKKTLEYYQHQYVEYFPLFTPDTVLSYSQAQLLASRATSTAASACATNENILSALDMPKLTSSKEEIERIRKIITEPSAQHGWQISQEDIESDLKTLENAGEQFSDSQKQNPQDLIRSSSMYLQQLKKNLEFCKKQQIRILQVLQIKYLKESKFSEPSEYNHESLKHIITDQHNSIREKSNQYFQEAKKCLNIIPTFGYLASMLTKKELNQNHYIQECEQKLSEYYRTWTDTYDEQPTSASRTIINRMATEYASLAAISLLLDNLQPEKKEEQVASLTR